MARSAPWPDCYDYVRRYYRVAAYIGMRVRYNGREGVLVAPRCPDQYVHIRFDGDTKVTGPFHPTDGITYLIGPTAPAGLTATEKENL